MKFINSPNINQNLKKYPNFIKLLNRKGINPSIFVPGDIIFDQDIREHAEWIYTNIYIIPYTDQTNKRHNRIHNGIQRAARIAIFVLIFANLYRRYQSQAASELTEDDVKIIQIVALFIDSARETEEIEKTEVTREKESGLILYHYLTNVLEIPSDKAALTAEILTNKNLFSHLENKLSRNRSGEMTWITKNKKSFISIQQELLHDAIYLDRLSEYNTSFNKYSLNFYTQIASKDRFAAHDLNLLIEDVKSFIVAQGNTQLKRTRLSDFFGGQNSYIRLQNIWVKEDAANYKILPQLFNNGKLLITLASWKFETAKHTTEINKLNESSIYSRNTTVLKIKPPKSFWEVNKYRVLVTAFFSVVITLSTIFFPVALFGIVPLAAFCIILAGNKPIQLIPFTFKPSTSPKVETESKPIDVDPYLDYKHTLSSSLRQHHNQNASTPNSSPLSLFTSENNKNLSSPLMQTPNTSTPPPITPGSKKDDKSSRSFFLPPASHYSSLSERTTSKHTLTP